MNELEKLKNELQEINNKQIRLQTIIDQAKDQCKEIEQKYNVSSEAELKQLLDKAEQEYLDKVTNATLYLNEAKKALAPFEELL